MKGRKGSIQIPLIILAVLIVGGIIIALFKFGVIERDSAEKLPGDSIGEVEVGENADELEEDHYDDMANNESYYDIEIGKEAPNFTLTNLQGEEVSLEDFRGKIVLINFWATWCVYCDLEMPDMQKLSDENDDLVILAVDVMEDKKLVEEYIEEGGYDFEVVLDGKGDVAKTYLVSAFPTSYFVDKDGVLLGGVPGMMTGPQMKEILENIRQGE